MNDAFIPGIKAQLKQMYPGYKFEMKSNSAKDNYCIKAYRETKELGSIEVEGELPMNTFWLTIQNWMRRII